MEPSNPQQQKEEGRIDLLDAAVLLRCNWKIAFGLPLLAGIAAIIVTFVINPVFTATARILPPQQQQGGIAAAMTAQLGALAGIAGGALGLKSPAEQYVGMLKSQTIQTAIVERFKLRERYDLRYTEDARKELESRSKISAGVKDGLITIEVDDEDPKLAAEMANAWVDQLRAMTNGLAVTEAAQRRLFFEAQLKQAHENLTKAELALRSSGISEATLKVLPHTALETTARLKAQITSQEVRLSSMRTFMTGANPEYQAALDQLAALRAELAKVEQSSVASASGTKDGEYISKFREFKYNEALFEIMARQFELARLDEAREGAVIQVVDAALPPERKSRPKRALVAALTSVATFFLMVVFLVMREKVRRLSEDPATADRVRQLGLRG